MDNECNGQTESNVPHKHLPGKMVNCRNLWFREFWSQHHKCSFNANSSAATTRCTGTEKLIDYEQEGLVPFVGKQYFSTFLTRVYDISSLYINNENKKYWIRMFDEFQLMLFMQWHTVFII